MCIMIQVGVAVLDSIYLMHLQVTGYRCSCSTEEHVTVYDSVAS